ncbi:unknown [Alistipes sp. CAG:831]|nr:unknown [Alistipes sp. CAG:831]
MCKLVLKQQGNNGLYNIRIFAFHCVAVDAVLRLLFFVGQNTGKSHFRKLSALPSDHRDSVAAACRQLFGAFLFRNPVQERQCGHSDEPFDLLPVLLAFQFGTHDIAGPLLHHKAPVTDAYQPLGHFFRPFLHRADVVARRDFADNCAVRSGCVAGHLWIRPGPQAYSGI